MSAHEQHQHHDGGGHGPGHAAHSHGGEDIDWEAMGAHLEREAELRIPFMGEAAAWIRGMLVESGRGPGSVERVLDVGSGPGVSTSVFAHAFPDASVVAVDGTPALLERAERRAGQQGVADRVTSLQAELPEDFGELGEADLVWTSHVVHHLGDQQAALDAFKGVLRPGGMLAVVERGLAARFLPRDIGLGRPGLQARLEAMHEEWFAEMRAALPGHVDVVEDWPMMLARAGLEYTGSRTFLIEYQAPLDASVREYLHTYLTRVRGAMVERSESGVPEDLAVLDVLLDEESPEGILQRPDAFYLAATTVHTGRA